MTDVVRLESRLDTAAAQSLRDIIARRIGDDISLDASGVELLGARCLEVLMTMRHLSMQAGQKVDVRSPSAAFVADLKTFGLVPDDISTGGTK